MKKRKCLAILLSMLVAVGSSASVLATTVSAATVAEVSDNDTMASAQSVALGDTVNGEIAKNDPGDFYKFELAKSGRLSYKMISYLERYDAQIYDVNGKKVWESFYNNWNQSTHQRTDTHPIDLRAGTYYLKIIGGPVMGGASMYTGRYSFTLNLTSANETFEENLLQNNDTLQIANVVPFDQKIKGQIAENDADDFYKFELSSSGRLTYKVTSYLKKYATAIYDEDGNVVWKSEFHDWDVSTQKRSDTHLVDLKAGTYYLKIVAGQQIDTPWYTGNYNFILSFKSANETFAEDFTKNNDSLKTASLAPFNQSVKGQIARNDGDFYKIKMPATGKLTYKVTSYLKSYATAIYDKNGNAVWKSERNVWDSATKKRSDTHAITLKKGTYYLKMSGGNWLSSPVYTGNYSFQLYFGETPSVTVTSPSKGKATLSWNRISGATGYQVYRSTSKSGTYTRVKTLPSSYSTKWTNSSLTSGQKYYYQVRSYKEVNGVRYYSPFCSIKAVKVK